MSTSIEERHAEQVWKHRFVVQFAAKLRGAINENGLLAVAYDHADASWPERDDDDTPEDAADGEIDALADNV